MKQDVVQAQMYLSPEQLSSRWQGQITTGTLAQWRHKATGPGFVKVGRKVLYLVSQVEAYEASSNNKETA